MWPGRYIAGNTIQKAIPVAKMFMQENKIPILNYMVEEKNKPNEIFVEYMTLLDNIDHRYKVAIKLSSLQFDPQLIEILIGKCVSKNVKLIIDAEEGMYNEKYQDISNYCIEKYNTHAPYIIKTYQMYRKDGLVTLENDLIENRKRDGYLGVKLVRGAYFHTERKDGYLFTDKKDTDNSYNNGILTVSKNAHKVYTILATHNIDSARLGYMTNMHHQNHIFDFGHLMGMQEEKYRDLAEKDANVHVYIPYGPYSKIIPYMSRRLYENMDMTQYMMK